MKQSHSMLKTITHGVLALIALAPLAIAQQSTVGSGSPSPTTEARPNPGSSSLPSTPSSFPRSENTSATPSADVKTENTQPVTPKPVTTPGPGTAAPAATTSPEKDSTDPEDTPSGGSALPQTTLFPDNGAIGTGTANDPLLQSGELPRGKVSLIGGTVHRIDNVRNRLTLQTFKGPKMKFNFDDRTKIFKDGTEDTQTAIRKGDRLYVDTQLDRGKLFVRRANIRTTLNPADASGQIVSYDIRRGLMVVNDQISGRPVTFRLAENPVIKKESGAGSQADLLPGALVQVQFVTGGGGSRGIAKEVKVLAAPGSAFTFFGRITHIDLRSNLVAVENKADQKTYDIIFSTGQVQNLDELTVGAEATIPATFNGKNYRAESVKITRTNAASSPNDDSESDAADFKDNDKVTLSDTDDKDAKKHKKNKKEEKNKKDKSDSDEADSPR